MLARNSDLFELAVETGARCGWRPPTGSRASRAARCLLELAGRCGGRRAHRGSDPRAAAALPASPPAGPRELRRCARRALHRYRGRGLRPHGRLPPADRVVEPTRVRPESGASAPRSCRSGTDAELLSVVVELEDRSAVRPRELHGCVTIVVSTSCRSSLELTASPTSLRACSSSTDRRADRAGLELLEQVAVLDRDRALGGEGGRQLDLPLVERIDASCSISEMAPMPPRR